MTNTTPQTYTVDASGRTLGRVASEIAQLLMGKNNPTFVRHIAPTVTVTVQHASQLTMTQKKRGEKEYSQFSGYPGGLRKETLESVIEKKGYGEVIRRAVYGMLPNNKLRPIMLKNLIIEE